MARKTSSFLIGLFVVTGVLLGMVGVIWLGMSRYFQKGTYYATYFDESVQGLSADSPVKYRGVEVGRVESIGVAPDNRLVEVVMRINLSVGQECEAVAQLKSAGLTGLVFVELDQVKPSEATLNPGPDFTPKYPVIPSRLSTMQGMMKELDEILGQVKKVDFQGISDRTKTLLNSAGGILADGRAARILSNLESTTESLSQASARAEGLLADGGIERLLEETKGMVTDGRGLLAEARGELGRANLAERVGRATESLQGFIESGQGAAGEAERVLVALKEDLEGMKLPETAGRARRLADELDQRTRSFSIEMRDSAANLRLVMEALHRLLDRLNDSPSDIIFSRYQDETVVPQLPPERPRVVAETLP